MNPLRWSLLIHNIPPKPAYLRNKVANRLSSLGAVALKNSVYLLPASPEGHEGFVWLAQEIESGGGRAFVGEVVFPGIGIEEEIKGSFQTARNLEYTPLIREAKRLLEMVTDVGNSGLSTNECTTNWRREIEAIRKRALKIRRIDFFDAPEGASLKEQLIAVESKLNRLENPADEDQEPALRDKKHYHRKTWVTRSGVYVDRIASAWLIRRFIDPEAVFRFVADREDHPREGEICFDMPGGEFTHEGEACTFEVLVRHFDVSWPAMKALAGIVHDLDLGGGCFQHEESPGIATVLSGIVASTTDDAERLQRGGHVMENLFHGLSTKA
ncbi:MAG: chromate resistance protein [Magnetococcales bacterium]|nr:chromate resistance protein [Magnetococcales bacterium]